MAGRIIKDFFTVIVLFFTILLLLTTFSLSYKYKLLAVRSGSMRPAIREGSLILAIKKDNYKKGEIIAYKIADNIITHRIYAIEASGGARLYTTKGDANNKPDDKPIGNNQILGKVDLIVPALGKLVLFTKTQAGFILLIIVPGTLIIYSELISLKNELIEKFAHKKDADEKDQN
jgi:signal peptidase